jgi:hypothetical protein
MRIVINILRVLLTDETWETLRIPLNDNLEVEIALADKLPPELLPEALTAARAIEDEWYLANALSGLAFKLPELLPELLELLHQCIGLRFDF